MKNNYIGISCYPGLDMSLDENIAYIKSAFENNINKCFISAHIPEQNKSIYTQLEIILNLLKELNFTVTIDISKKYLNKLVKYLDKDICLRLDFGFDNEEIVNLSKKYLISINASVIDEPWLQQLILMGLNLRNVNAFHNFYLKPLTGLSIKYFYNQNLIFKKYNLSINSFVGGDTFKRGPLKQSLVTVEEHRNKNLSQQIQDLKLLGSNYIYFGDLKTNSSELKILNKYNNSNPPIILFVKSNIDLNIEEKKLLLQNHKLRKDNSEYILRSDKLFLDYSQFNIIPNNNFIKINKYDITIDNNNYSRYKGELNIWLTSNKEDENINVIGQIKNNYILKYLKNNIFKIFIE